MDFVELNSEDDDRQATENFNEQGEVESISVSHDAPAGTSTASIHTSSMVAATDDSHPATGKSDRERFNFMGYVVMRRSTYDELMKLGKAPSQEQPPGEPSTNTNDQVDLGK